MAVAAAGDLPASPALAGIARTGPADQANGAYLEVAAASPADVWAVGGSSGNRALIVHWNGTAWRRVPSPDPRPGDDDALSGVAAASVSDIWAVGHAGDKTLIEHWNGEAWQQVPSPSPRPRSETGDALSAVTVASARNAWAVGTKELPSGLAGTLIEHWNGRAWRRVPSPSPPLGCSDDVNYLSSVAVTSARSAWAVGTDGVDCAQSYFERWNGTAWKITHRRIRHLGSGWTISALAATTARSVWAVGSTFGFEPLILHWNGSVWQRVHSPAA